MPIDFQKFPLHNGYSMYVKRPDHHIISDLEWYRILNKIFCYLYCPPEDGEIYHAKLDEQYQHFIKIAVTDIINGKYTPEWYDESTYYFVASDLICA